MTVNATSATLRTSDGEADLEGTPCIGLAWPRDGQWLQIQTCEDSEGTALSVDDVVQVAEGIASGTTQSTPWDSLITGVSLPEGYVIDHWIGTSLSAHGAQLGQITVAIDDSATPIPADAGPVTVDGRPAFYGDGVLRVVLPDDRVLRIQTLDASLPDLVAIYETVTLA